MPHPPTPHIISVSVTLAKIYIVPYCVVDADGAMATPGDPGSVRRFATRKAPLPATAMRTKVAANVRRAHTLTADSSAAASASAAAARQGACLRLHCCSFTLASYLRAPARQAGTRRP
jgi:hypothetical protein